MAEAITLTGTRRRLVEIDALVALGWLADRAAVLRGCSGSGQPSRQHPKIQNISGLPQGRGRPLTGTLSFASGDPLAAVRPNGERA